MRSIEELKASAERVFSVDDSSVKAYAGKDTAMAAVVTNMLAGRGDLHSLIGEDNMEVMADNHRKHATFISAMLENFRPELFVETLAWVFRTYRARGFSEDYWRVQLNAWRDALAGTLGPEHAEQIDRIYVWMLENLDDLIILSKQNLTPWEDV
jgi:hypothetical protein